MAALCCPTYVVATAVGCCAAIVREETPALLAAEWCAVCDVLNGTWTIAEHTETDPARHLWAEMADAPEMSTKWGIDHGMLVAKLRGLTYGQRVAVVEVVGRFWRSPRLNSGASHADLITEAGAKIIGH